jgi:hypothetical protein
MDNAKNNDTLMKSLWQSLESIFQPSQIRCLAHVINLGIQTALSSLCCRPASENSDHQDAPRPLKNVRTSTTTFISLGTQFFFFFLASTLHQGIQTLSTKDE